MNFPTYIAYGLLDLILWVMLAMQVGPDFADWTKMENPFSQRAQTKALLGVGFLIFLWPIALIVLASFFLIYDGEDEED